jgi:hypothetical protein
MTKKTNTRVRITVSLDKSLVEQMKLIHGDEEKKAKSEDRVKPCWSYTVEMLLRKGVKAYKKAFSIE